jgi:hypothetical protein
MAKFQVTSPTGEVFEIEAPDGASEADVMGYAREQFAQQAQPPAQPEQAPERGLVGEALRKAEYGARGLSDSMAETVGAVPDLMARGMNYAGDAVGIPQEYLPSKDGYWTNAIKSGMRGAGELAGQGMEAIIPGSTEFAQGPATGGDRTAYGAGRGVGDAASFMLPAAAISKASKAGGVANNVARSLMAQPAMQATAGAAGGAVGEATGNPYLGAAASLAVPVGAAIGARAISPFPNQLSPMEQQSAKMAKKMGVELTPGQTTGSRPLQAAESQLAKMPFSAGPQQAIYDGQRGALNRSILGKAGIDADNVTPEMVDDAYRTLGAQFDDLARQTRVEITPQFFDQIDNVANEYGRRLPTDIKPVFQSYVDDLNAMRGAVPNGPAGQTLPGQSQVFVEGPEFQKITSGLKAAARRAKNNPDLQNALNGLIDSVDDAMVRSASPEVAQGWKATNRAYRNLLTIDDAIARGSRGERSGGDVPLQGLKSAAQSKDPRGMARGRGDFADDIRVGEFLADKIPNSGTAERSLLTGMMTGATGPGTGMGAMLLGADPGMAMAAGGAAYAVPPLVQKLINSPMGRQYLTNQLGVANTMSGPLTAKLLAAREKDRQLNPSR